MGERVVVFGATSAVAAEIASLYAQRGARLHLVGRNPEKLADVVRRCAPAEITSTVADLSVTEDCERLVGEAFDALGGVDTVLVAQGDLGDQLASEGSFEHAESTLRLNFLGVVALVIPVANRFEAARGGKICVIGSVAGERGRPRNYTYGSAKGALKLYLQGVRSRLHTKGVQVTTIMLGPVDSPMTVDHPKNALFGTPPDVARAIVRAVDRGVAEAYVPWYWGLIMPAVRAVPERIFQKLGFLSGR